MVPKITCGPSEAQQQISLNLVALDHQPSGFTIGTSTYLFTICYVHNKLSDVDRVQS